MTNSKSKPKWWIRNERLRTEMKLPNYSPPRFKDGSFVHEVILPIEWYHNCLIRFIGVNTTYLENWEVRIDGHPSFSIGRHRDEEGNTIYEMSSEAFRKRVNNCLEYKISD